jgi:hypothetical protein
MKDANVIRTMENIMRMMPVLVVALLLTFGSKALLHSLNKPKKAPKVKKYKQKRLVNESKAKLDFEQSNTEVI